MGYAFGFRGNLRNACDGNMSLDYTNVSVLAVILYYGFQCYFRQKLGKGFTGSLHYFLDLHLNL